MERFELIIKLVLNQPPLPIGLHARNEFRISDFELRIAVCATRKLTVNRALVLNLLKSEIRNPKSEIAFGTGGGIRTHTV